MGRAVTFIKDALSCRDNTIFVHCASGVSRSVSMVLAFLILIRGRSFEDGLKLIRRGRKQANPNYGFRFQLCHLIKCGRDLDRAAKSYSEAIKKDESNPMVVVRQQRQEASDVFTKLNEIEYAMKTKDDGAERGLSALRDKIVSMKKRFESSVLCDRPALSMIKSAVQKADRLMKECGKISVT